MNTIQRYIMKDPDEDGYVMMDWSEDGDWVRFEDHKKIVTELNEQIAKLLLSVYLAYPSIGGE